VKIRFGHSPDPDDAFMFYAIAKEKIWTDPFVITHVVEEIERLNQRALTGELEVTAVSMHAYAYCADKYRLLTCGASVGNGYGPILVSKKNFSDLKGKRIGIPGKLTTARLVLNLFAEGFVEEFLPFDRIIPALQEGKVDAGLLIHEGQVTYADLGLKKIVDLGEWWKKKTGLPLVLGVDVIRKDISEEVAESFDDLFRRCIEYSLSHRDEAIQYAMPFGRGLVKTKTDRFIGMYVNDDTLDYGEKGRESIQKLFEEARKKRLIPKTVSPEFVSDGVLNRR